MEMEQRARKAVEESQKLRLEEMEQVEQAIKIKMVGAEPQLRRF